MIDHLASTQNKSCHPWKHAIFEYFQGVTNSDNSVYAKKH